MEIKSLTLYVSGHAEKRIMSISDKVTIRQALDILLGDIDIDIDLEKSDYDEINLPVLVADFIEEHINVSLSYGVFDNDGSGLLHIAYKKGFLKQRNKCIGQVGREDFEQYLEQALVLSKDEFVSAYIKKYNTFDVFANAMAIFTLSCSLLGVISFGLNDVLYLDNVVDEVGALFLFAFFVNAGMLIPRFFSDDAKTSRKAHANSFLKLTGMLIIGNCLLSSGTVLGGMSLWHWATSRTTQEIITFSNKGGTYYQKKCNGSVSIEHYMGTLCLDSRPYWTVIQPGMKARAIGRLSSIGLTIDTIDISPPTSMQH